MIADKTEVGTYATYRFSDNGKWILRIPENIEMRNIKFINPVKIITNQIICCDSIFRRKHRSKFLQELQ